MSSVIFVHRRRVDEVGRRVGFLEVDDKLAETLISRGVAKFARKGRTGKPAPLKDSKPANDQAKAGKPSEGKPSAKPDQANPAAKPEDKPAEAEPPAKPEPKPQPAPAKPRDADASKD